MASHSSAGLIQNPISMYILIHAPRVPPVATSPVVTDIEQFSARLIWGNARYLRIASRSLSAEVVPMAQQEPTYAAGGHARVQAS